MSRRHHHRRGFTIMEILIALMVMTIGFVAMYSLQIVAIAGNSTAQEFTQATTLAERWVESLRRDAISWTSSANIPPSLRQTGSWQDAFNGTMVNKDLQRAGDRAEVLDPRFCIKYRVSPVPQGTPNTQILRVDVRVLWPRRDGSLSRFVTCPAEMLETQHLQSIWQVSLPTLLYRHESSL